MNTIDPLQQARAILSTDCLQSWLECWRDTPPDECQGMVRGYIDSHLLDRGVALPTEDDVGERIEAADIAVSSGDLYTRAEGIHLAMWIDCWWATELAVAVGKDEFFLDAVESTGRAYRHDGRFVDVWGVPKFADSKILDDIRWWCALYARYGKRIFWGEGYT